MAARGPTDWKYMTSSIRSRVLAPLITLLVATALVVMPVAAAPAGAVAPTSTGHPYSDPVWYPLRAKVYLDCVLTNPGCNGTHAAWMVDMVRETIGGPAGDTGVYAMGAGRLHVGDAHGSTCGHGNNFGTWVWIDHGGGVVSRYGHLGSIALTNGSYVAAGQRIGTMGTTGKDENCAVPYLNFQVRHGGVSGPRIQIKTLKVCDPAKPGSVRTWPTDLDATAHWRPSHAVFTKPTAAKHYGVWNDVPKRSVDFPATTGSCVPSTVPSTPQRPAGVTLSRSGSGALTAHWRSTTTPPATRVQLRLSEYHTSTHTWDYVQNETFVYLAPTTTAYRFIRLLDGRPYRLTVSFHNAAGWGLGSPWATRSPAAAPDPPRFRDLSVSGVRTRTVHFKWWVSRTHGVAVSSYEVQIRRVFTDHYSAWTTKHTAQPSTAWSGLRRHAKYQVRVRALSRAGNAGYLVRVAGT
jgi:hypothetical protein